MRPSFGWIVSTFSFVETEKDPFGETEKGTSAGRTDWSRETMMSASVATFVWPFEGLIFVIVSALWFDVSDGFTGGNVGLLTTVIWPEVVGVGVSVGCTTGVVER